MAYDEGLQARIDELTDGEAGLTSKRMFGGLCYLVNGNMAFGIVGDEIMVRVGKEVYDTCLALPHAREMDFTGRALKGMVYVDPVGIAEDSDLSEWLSRGLKFAGSLPPK